MYNWFGRAGNENGIYAVGKKNDEIFFIVQNMNL